MAQKISRILFYSVWAVLMTALTYILGAVGLKVLRQKLGRTGYWALTTVLSVGFFAIGAKPLALAFFSLVVLMGVFSELEELHLSFTLSAFFTLLLNALIAGGATALWVSRIGPKWTGMVQSSLEMLLKPVAQLNASIQINYTDLMVQLPSIVLILWMGAIYVAVLLEGRLSAADRAPAAGDPHPTMRQQLSQLRLPDAVVWLFILSLLGSFGGFEVRGLQAVSANVLNVSFVLFFFQGIAVVSKFFERLRMGSFWQFVFMVLIVVHLFLFVSLVGLMDYWVDFRSRLEKRTTEFNREA
jgi:hypothetical protein